MDKKTLLLSGLLSLAPVTLTNAQKVVSENAGKALATAKEIVLPKTSRISQQFVSETGISGVFNAENSFYTGINYVASTKRNYFDGFLGGCFSEKKQGSFMALALDNFKWAQHTPFSSWVRGVFSASKRGQSFNLEASPVRLSVPFKKFNFALNPAAVVKGDFKSPVKVGLNQIGQVTYNVTKNDALFFEAKYMATPARNVKDIKFGPMSKNTSYMASYMHTFRAF